LFSGDTPIEKQLLLFPESVGVIARWLKEVLLFQKEKIISILLK
jgi:hypothetical protein